MDASEVTTHLLASPTAGGVWLSSVLRCTREAGYLEHALLQDGRQHVCENNADVIEQGCCCVAAQG